MQKPRDLARALQEKETRKRYLHPNKRSLFAILWRLYAPVRKSPRIVLASITYALTSGVLPLLGVLVTYVLVGLLSAPDASPQRMLVAAGVYGAVFFVCSALSRQVKNRNSMFFTRLRLQYLQACNARSMSMDLGLFENAAFNEDTETAYWSLSSSGSGVEGTYDKVFDLGGTLVSAALLGAMLSLLSPLMLALGIAYVAVMYFAQANVGAFKHKRRMELAGIARRSAMLSRSASDFHAGKDVRLYDMAGKFQQVFEPIFAANMKLYRAFTKRELQLSFLESLALVAVDLVGGLLLINKLLDGALAMADFVMLLSALVLFTQLMMTLAQQLSYVKVETLYVQDAFDFLDADLNSLDGTRDIPGEGPVEVVFVDVSFSYPGTDRLVLENLSFTLKKGERCALVGLNGAGKTTLVKLLMGLYRPLSGRILINGIDASAFSRQSLYAAFGAVFQEVEPLALTIAETVAVSTRDIDRERVEESLKTAGLWDKVKSLKKGMDTPLLKIIHEDGAILSGGENQKLMIARALYRKGTRIMVMDEPTSALDALAEQAIYQHFDSILKGRTALFISHRLASTRFCDRILLLDGGKIAQHGTHEELIAKEGLYRQLFLTQGKYYQQEGGSEA